MAWKPGRWAERPGADAPGRFRPVMLAVALDEATDFPRLAPADYAAEWKWDGIRVQAVREGGIDSLASTAGLEPGLPAWRVLYEAVRRKHGLWGEDSGGPREAREPSESSEATPAVMEGEVPLPLAPAF